MNAPAPSLIDYAPTQNPRQRTVGTINVIAGGIRSVFGLPAAVLLFFIRIYQRTLSPALPVIFGAACGCRFSPTCSHYAADAIRAHGAVAGTVLALIRLVKCTPLHPGGFDPVPPPRAARRCERMTR
jgi:putative membrane protein insertion efficiency factor